MTLDPLPAPPVIYTCPDDHALAWSWIPDGVIARGEVGKYEHGTKEVGPEQNPSLKLRRALRNVE